MAKRQIIIKAAMLNAIKERMQSLELNQKDLAIATGIPRTQLNQFLQGKVMLSQPNCGRVWRFLGLDAELLINGTDYEKYD